MKKKIKLRRIIFILIAFYAGYIIVNQQITMKRITAETAIKKEELRKLKEKNERLQDEIKMSKTNEYVERLARERLGFIKEGETPVIDIPVK